jgi:hypothetical protein
MNRIRQTERTRIIAPNILVRTRKCAFSPKSKLGLFGCIGNSLHLNLQGFPVLQLEFQILSSTFTFYQSSCYRNSSTSSNSFKVSGVFSKSTTHCILLMVEPSFSDKLILKVLTHPLHLLHEAFCAV